VTGEPWSYTFWAPGEPNGGSGENYILTWTSDGRWNDGGGGNAPYILEKEYFSNPKLIDSDSDGYPDLNETQLGTDPSSYDSSPSSGWKRSGVCERSGRCEYARSVCA
jgi:hypothetical protein